MRPQEALALYRRRVPAAVLRDVLRAAWVNDSGPFIASIKRTRLLKMFRYAAFEVPADLPEQFRVWRAVQGCTVQAAVMGLSWTPDRWAAYALAGDYQIIAPSLPAAVVTRTIWKRDVIFFHNHNAREVVFDSTPTGEIAGTSREYHNAWLSARGFS